MLRHFFVNLQYILPPSDAYGYALRAYRRDYKGVKISASSYKIGIIYFNELNHFIACVHRLTSKLIAYSLHEEKQKSFIKTT